VIEQVKTYIEADIVPKNGLTKVLYEDLKSRILKLDDQLRPHVTKTYISFRLGENWRNIFSIAFRTNRLRIDLFRTQPGDLLDPEKKLIHIKESVQWWNQHVSYLELSSDKELEYVVYLLQQTLERFRTLEEV
jgi:predicted transport protein